jgi:hypothetical protein
MPDARAGALIEDRQGRLPVVAPGRKRRRSCYEALATMSSSSARV